MAVSTQFSRVWNQAVFTREGHQIACNVGSTFYSVIKKYTVLVCHKKIGLAFWSKNIASRANIHFNWSK